MSLIETEKQMYNLFIFLKKKNKENNRSITGVTQTGVLMQVNDDKWKIMKFMTRNSIQKSKSRNSRFKFNM